MMLWILLCNMLQKGPPVAYVPEPEATIFVVASSFDTVATPENVLPNFMMFSSAHQQEMKEILMPNP